MPISTLMIRCCPSSVAPKISNYSVKTFVAYCSTPAEKFLEQMHGDEANVERNLSSVKAKLDSRCVTQVLERCTTDRPRLGVRFFIWAALHPTHRHTSYMYNKACDLLGVDRNPRIIVDVMEKYRDEGFAVSLKIFKVVLNLCRAAKDAEMGLWILGKMKEYNCRPDTVSYNVVIRLLVEKGDLDGAMGVMKEMDLIDVYPNMVTYVLLIKGFCDAGRVEDAIGLIKVMEGHGCELNSVVYSALIDGLCRYGSLEMAMEFLGNMGKEHKASNPNVVTYTILIKGFVEKGRALEAVRFLDRMDDSGVKPNRVTFATLLDGLCKEDHVDEACKIVDKHGGGEYPFDELYSLLVISLLRAGKHKESESTFNMMIACGLRPSGLASGKIMKQILSKGRTMDAFSLFSALENSGNFRAIDSDVFSILLLGLCQEHHFIEAAGVVRVIAEEKLRLKSPHLETMIEHLNLLGECDLASAISQIVL